MHRPWQILLLRNQPSTLDTGLPRRSIRELTGVWGLFWPRRSMESMRFSMDSMRSAGSPPGTPRSGDGAKAAGFTDYRGSSLFAYSGPFTGSASPTPAAFPAKGSPEGAPVQVRAIAQRELLLRGCSSCCALLHDGEQRQGASCSGTLQGAEARGYFQGIEPLSGAAAQGVHRADSLRGSQGSLADQPQ